ncbi:tetratricopeptide repeat protein [Candidatus Peregrinibacteria bacterium]|nr:tetratricopeptide repeat protein [Candidatus Peregrinibacteria bacterium]
MWTYLAIFLSLTAILIVFVRRLVLKKRAAIEAGRPVEETPVEEPEDQEIASKSDRAKAQALCDQAEGFLKAGKDDEAIKCFVQALALDSLHQETQYRLAMLYLQKQMFSAAAALFEQLALSTEDPVLFSHLGLALYQQGEMVGAKGAYQKALELDDSRPQRFVSLAQVYKALGQLNNAVIALVKAIEAEEQNTDYLFLLAELQTGLGHSEQAKEIVKRILELEPRNKEAKEMLKSFET